MPEKRYDFDSDGKIIGCRSVLFEDVRDDYELQDFTTSISAENTYSQVMALNILHTHQNEFPMINLSANSYQEGALHELAIDYIVSASSLQKVFRSSLTGISFNPHYFLPCAYCCRHAVELLLKYGIFRKTKSVNSIKKNHWLAKLWPVFRSYYIDERVDKFDEYIGWLILLDDDGSKLRYGFDNQGNPYSIDSYMFNLDVLVDDSKYFFDVIDCVIRDAEVEEDI